MKNGFYVIGYDLNYEYCQISCSSSLTEEPETIYLMDEKEGTELPLILAKRDENSGWVTGMEALRMDAMAQGIVVKDLLRLSLDKAQIRIGNEEFNSTALLAEYIKLSLQRLLIPDYSEETCYFVFTLPMISEDAIMLIKSIANRLGIPKGTVFVQDYRESFYDYISHQSRELWNYEVALFGFSETGMYAYKLQKEPLPKGRKKELVSVIKSPTIEIDTDKSGDRAFLAFAKEVFGRSLISSVFLIGKEFEENWWSESLEFLCKNRRVFQGRNLFSKGACYGGYRKSGLDHPDAIYLDPYKIVSQVSLRLRIRGKEQWYPLAYQGENWYEINRSVEILADQSTQLQIQVDTINKLVPHQESIALEGLFEKQRRTVRLRVELIFLSKNRCRISVRDVDFGELRKASGYELTSTIQLENINA